MQAASTGRCTFPDGTEFELSVKDWLDLVWKVYGQIDGPPRDYKIEGDVKITGPGVLLPPVDMEDDQTDEG